jgi:hypothetical protein
LGRRIAVVLLATLLAQIAFRGVGIVLMGMNLPGFLGVHQYFLLVYCLQQVGIPPLVYLLLRASRNDPAAGFIGKLATGPLLAFRLATLAVFALWFCMPSASFISGGEPATTSTIYFETLGKIFGIGGATAMCLVWIWWCDQKPRTFLNIRTAAAAWTMVAILLRLLQAFTPLAFGLDTHQGLVLRGGFSEFGGINLFSKVLERDQLIYMFAVPLLVGLATAYLYGILLRGRFNETKFE